MADKQFTDIKIKSLVDIKKFEPVINPEWIVDNDLSTKSHLIANYIMTEDIAQMIEAMLEGFTEIRATSSKNKAELAIQTLKQAHLITGTYGTGKSYLLLMLLGLFKALREPGLYDELAEKFSEYPYLVEHLARLRGKKYLTVCINAQGLGGDVSFKDLVVRGLVEQFQKETGETLSLNSEFDTALNVLNHMKESFARQMPKGESLEGLRNALCQRRRPALDVFRDVFKKITGSQPESYGTDLDSILSDAIKQVKSKGYEGILFIVDEFSQYLGASMAAGRWAQDLAQLQLFADKVCNDLRNRVYFIASVHEALTRVGSMTDTDRNKLEVVLDRFRNHPLPYLNFAKLITGIFKVNKPQLSVLARRTTPNHELLVELAKPTGAGYQDYFPLHPSVVTYLPVVSRKLASSQRTTFLFLAEYVSGQRLDEPAVTEDGELNLVTLVDMIDWFWGVLASKGYDNVLQAANIMLQYYREDSLAQRVVKLLVALYIGVAGNENMDIAQYSASPTEIAHMLSASPDGIQTILSALENKQEGVIQCNSDGRYYFSTQIAPPIRPTIMKYIDSVNPDRLLLEQIKTGYPLVKATYDVDVDPTYNIRVSRSVIGRQVSLADFIKGKVDYSVPSGSDGVCVFVVPGLGQQYGPTDKAAIAAVAKVVVEKNKNVVIGYPYSMMQLMPHEIRWFGAVQMAKMKAGKDDQMIITALDRELQNGNRTIKVQIDRWLRDDNFHFVCAYKTSKNAGLYAVMKTMLRDYYYKFPAFGRESLSSGAVKDMANRILQAPDKIATPLESNAQIEGRNGHLLKTLVPLGLAKFTEENSQFIGHLTEPREGDSLEIWQIIQFGFTPEEAAKRFGHDHPSTRVVRGELAYSKLSPPEATNLGGIYKSIQKTYDKLMAAPYGLPNELIELYLVCLIGLGKARVKGGAHSTLTPKDISTKKDRVYGFYRINTLSIEARSYLSNVLQLIAEANNRSYSSDLVPQVGQVDEDRVADELKIGFRLLLEKQVLPCSDAFRTLGMAKQDTGVFIEAVRRLISISDSEEVVREVSGLGSALAGAAVDLDRGYTLVRNAVKFYSELRPKTSHLVASANRFKVLQKVAANDAGYATLLAATDKALKQLLSEGTLVAVARWFERFEALWSAYVEQYNDEHAVVASTYRELYETVMSADDLRILSALSAFGFTDVAGPEHVRSHLNKFQACTAQSPLGLDYLTAAEVNCSACRYTTGKHIEAGNNVKQAKEMLLRMLQTAVEKACGKVLDYCQDSSASRNMTCLFPAYLMKGGHVQEARMIQAILADLLKHGQVDETDLQKVRNAGKQFAKYLREAKKVKDAPPPKPKVSMSTLLQQVQAQLVASGSVEVPVEKVLSAIETFLAKNYHGYLVRIGEGDRNG